MNKLIPVFFLLAACGSESRDVECEVDGCDQTTVDNCKDAVVACEDGGLLVDACVDTLIAANDISCEVDDAGAE